MQTKPLYEFADFRLDLSEKILLRDGKPVPLTPKVFDTLTILTENAGRLLEKDELIKKIWQDRFVEESNLTFNIKMLRKALGDNAGNPQFIETVQRRGYRFIAEVRRVETEDEKPEPASEIPVSQLNEKNAAPAEFSHPVKLSETQTSGAAALTDWRYGANGNVSKKSEPSFALGNPNGKSLTPESVPAMSLAKNKRGKFFFLSAGLIFVGVLAVFSYGFYRLLSRADSAGDFRALNFTRLTANGKTKTAAASPDGKFVAYVLDNEGQQSLWLKNTAAGSDVQILPPSENTALGSLTFSPNGDYVYYAAKGTLYQLPILGGLAKKILQNFGLGSITFSPDGRQFAFTRFLSNYESAVILANADGTNERILASSKRPENFLPAAAWSPDGTIIAVTAQTADGKNAVVLVRAADGVVAAIPPQRWGHIKQIAWQPQGGVLFVIGTEGRSSISAQIWRLSYPGGEARPVTNDLNSYESIGFAADGREMVAVIAEQIVYIWVLADEKTSKVKQLTHGIGRYDGIFGLSYLSEGKIAYETVAENGNGEIWILDADGRNSKKLLNEAGSTTASPDGKYFVFQSSDDEGKNAGLFRFDPRTGEKQRLTTGADVWATFSPDGRWVVFTRWAEKIALWKVSIDGSEAVKLTNIPGAPLAPTVSPDGKLIAFTWVEKDFGRLPEIALMPFDGGEIIKTFPVSFGYSQGAGKKALQWTPDGQFLKYIAHRDGISNIWQQSVDGSPPVQITNFESGRIFNFSYSPDGKHLVLSRGTFNRDVVIINNVE